MKNGISSNLFASASMFGLCLVLAPAASAQQGAPAAENAAELDEILVTANKRAQSVNDVPMSITAISGEALENARITDVSQLERLTPGYTFAKVYNSVPVLTIRGVGYYDNSLAAPPAVSSYVDEVPLPYPVLTSGALLDLERVEILKGPQGTLFGQNSTGGAINFIAGKPKDTFGANASLGFGRFNTVEATAMVTGPISETLSFRIAGRYESGSAWQRSYTHGGKLGEVDRGAGRITLDWNPSSRLRTSLAVEAWYDKSDSQAGQLIGLNLAIPGNQNPALATGSGAPGDPIVQVYPNSPKNNRVADWTPGSNYASDNMYYRASFRAEYDLSDAITLTSITAYQDLDYDSNVDSDATSLTIAELRTLGDISAFYQELRLAGDVGRLKWMVGGNYSSDKVRTVAPTNLRDWSQPIGDVVVYSRNKIETVAGFANLEYEVIDKLTVQGSIRYTESRNRFNGCAADSGNGVAAAIINGFGGTTDLVAGGCYTRNDLDFSFVAGEAKLVLKEDNVSWRAGLNYAFNADTLIYANVSKGYKAGAFPFPAINLASQAAPAKQESLMAYEAGFKVGIGSFQINGAGFYYDYSDKQLLVPFDYGDPFHLLDKIQNIPKSRIVGGEMQMIWSPLDGLQFTVQGTYVNSKVKSSFIIPFTQADGSIGGQNIRGERFPYTPRWQGLADVNYSFALSGSLNASLGARLSGRSSTHARFGGNPLYHIKGYSLLDLRAGIETEGGKYAFDIWANNVTNRYYRTNVTTFADTVYAYTGQPATYGARVRVQF